MIYYNSVIIMIMKIMFNLKFFTVKYSIILVFVSSRIIKFGLTYLKHTTLNVAKFIFHAQEL